MQGAIPPDRAAAGVLSALAAATLWGANLALTRLGVVAVARLGAARAASFGAITPCMAALFGALLLGEIPAPEIALACLGAGAGIVLANRAAPSMRGRRAPAPGACA
jgi:drug/metabolite transporter (DMT)-like permease